MNRETVKIREAVPEDAPAMLAIYRPFVETTAVSFEEVVPSLEEFRSRIAKYAAGWSCLVAERESVVLGYANGSALRERPAYRWSVETTIYVSAGSRKEGVGRALYGELFRRCAAAGFRNAYAGVVLPNDASVGFHRSSGFTQVGHWPRVGFKFGAWRDMAWFHRVLRGDAPETARAGGES